jgi:hypothetical protein
MQQPHLSRLSHAKISEGMGTLYSDVKADWDFPIRKYSLVVNKALGGLEL